MDAMLPPVLRTASAMADRVSTELEIEQDTMYRQELADAKLAMEFRNAAGCAQLDAACPPYF